MGLELNSYQTLVFDCDGVVLDSNKVKTQAFYDVALSFGHDKAQALVDYHVRNGGVSRYLKFEYFIEKILRKPITELLLGELLDSFASEVKGGLLKSDIATGLEKLRKTTPLANWLIVSGGDQDELREVFAIRGLFELFDGGVFGSPDTKDIILNREIGCLNIQKPALFLGDSKYDYQAADNAGIDFVFLTDWTEVSDWKEWIQLNRIEVFNKVSDLVNN